VDLTTAGPPVVLSRIMGTVDILRIRELVREVPVAGVVKDLAIRLALATRPGTPLATEMVSRYVRYGASPRGPQGMVLAAKAKALFDGRMNAGFADVRGACRQALRHRILLNFEGEAEGITSERIIDDVLARIPDTAGEG
jgi:MoxR-like ATPase